MIRQAWDQTGTRQGQDRTGQNKTRQDRTSQDTQDKYRTGATNTDRGANSSGIPGSNRMSVNHTHI